MTTNVNPQRKRSLKHGSYILTGIMLIAAAGSFFYSYYFMLQREAAIMPRHIIAALLGDLQKFHKEQGRYPESLVELQDKLWRTRHKEEAALGEGGHSMARQFYYYLYGREGPHVCKFWAVPIGSRTDGLSTYYVELTGGGMNVWKGAALDKEDFKKINPLMSERALYDLGLTKQPPRTASPKSSSKITRMLGWSSFGFIRVSGANERT